MSIQARLNTSMCATVAVGILAFAIADSAWFLLLLGIVGPLVAWFAGRPAPEAPDAGPWTLPRWAVSTLVFLAIASAVLQATILRDGTPLVSNLGAFLTYVQLIKLFDRRASRDESQLLGLSVFTAIAAILTSNSLLVGVLLAVYTPLIVGAAMRMEIGSGRDMGGGATIISGRALGVHLRRAIGASVASACLLAAAVFLTAPRGVGNDWLGTFGSIRRAQVGFTDDIRLGQQGNLNESPTPVLELTVTDSEGRNLGDPSRPMYLRGATRDSYDQRGFWLSASARAPERNHSAEEELVLSEPGPRPAYITQSITMRARIRGNDDYVFCTWRPVVLKFGQPAKAAVSRSDLTVKQGEGDQRWSGRWTYQVLSAVNDFDQPDDNPVVSNAFAQGEIHELARRVLTERAGPRGANAAPDDLLVGMDRRQAASMLRDYLRQNFEYTLQMTMPKEGQDPIEMFLFDTKRGHCEYFASAMVAMCQSVGIPARIVAGYVATEFNVLTGQYIVRESNAHAWAEVWTGPGKWLTMDPSPPGDIERIHAPHTGLLSRIKTWYDLIEFNWNEAIVTFDRSSQLKLFRPYEDGSSFFARIGDRVRDAARAVGRNLGLISSDGAVGVLARVIWWSVVAVVVGAAAWLVWRRVMLGVMKRGGTRTLDPEMRALLAQAGFYPRALRGLERAGIGKPRARGAVAHAAWIASRDRETAAAFGSVAELFYRVRFGRARLSDQERAEAAEALAKIQRAQRVEAGLVEDRSARPAQSERV